DFHRSSYCRFMMWLKNPYTEANHWPSAPPRMTVDRLVMATDPCARRTARLASYTASPCTPPLSAKDFSYCASQVGTAERRSDMAPGLADSRCTVARNEAYPVLV